MTREKTRTTGAPCNLGWLFGLSLLLWAVSGCGPSGVGSVDLPAGAGAKVGAPPKPKPGAARPASRPDPPRKAPPTYIPG
jgi:hypothetical protein